MDTDKTEQQMTLKRDIKELEGHRERAKDTNKLGKIIYKMFDGKQKSRLMTHKCRRYRKKRRDNNI